MDLPPVMIYGDDVTHILTEEGIANLLLCRTDAEREQAIRGVAGYTPVGLARDNRMVENLRDRGIIRRPEDLSIDKRHATRDLLAARSIKDLVALRAVFTTRPNVSATGRPGMETLTLTFSAARAVNATARQPSSASWLGQSRNPGRTRTPRRRLHVEIAHRRGLRRRVAGRGRRFLRPPRLAESASRSTTAAPARRDALACSGRARPRGGAMTSYYEACAARPSARLLDPASFHEFMRPERAMSPHLQLDRPPPSTTASSWAATLDEPVYAAAQEGGFMGGAVGEIHGAKLVGLLERARDEKSAAVLLLVESGGVRLHEANAGDRRVGNHPRHAGPRSAGVPVIVLDGGHFGCFGGMGIVARLCDTIVISEEGRLGLSGPEVIETTCGVEEFDSARPRLVWRTVGGKHRYLLGEANDLVADNIASFRRRHRPAGDEARSFAGGDDSRT